MPNSLNPAPALTAKRRLPTRAVAAVALAPVLRGEASLDLDAVFARVEESERGFLQTLCLGVLRDYFGLVALVKSLLAKPLKAKDADIHALLLLGIYQLDFLRVPDHAAISATVDASKALNKPWASKLINGVLRSYLRQRDVLKVKLEDAVEAQYQHPQWLVDALQKAYPEQWQSIVLANSTQPPICLRANPHLLDRNELQAQLTEVDVDSALLPNTSLGLRLKSQADIRQLPGFEQGAFAVQDESAQHAAELLELQKDDRVLDACSAPGGKASHIAQLYPTASLICVEQDEKRMQKMHENFERLGVSAKMVLADASDLPAWWDGKLFNAILLDAPCSGTGVIRRHPDIKLLRREADIATLSQLQLSLLTQLWSTLAPGGVLLYATCSVLPAENEKVIAAFLTTQTDAVHDSIASEWGIVRPYGKQIIPELDGPDGFYYCRLKKH